MDEKELQKLYDAMNSKFDVGDFNTFKTKMQTPEDRKKFYDVVGKNGFDLGDYNQFEERIAGVKKKPSNDGATGLAEGSSTTQSLETEIPLVSTPKTENTFQSETPSEDDVIGQAQYADELRKRTKTIAGRTMPDEEAAVYAGSVEKGLEAKGYDAKKIAQDFTGIPDYAFNVKGLTKPELLEKYKSNKPQYERNIATAKAQSALRDELYKLPNGKQLWADVVSSYNAAGVGDAAQQRENLRRIVSVANSYGGEKSDEIVKNLGIDFSNLYGKESLDVANIEKDPKSAVLNNIQLGAWHLLEDTKPNELNKYKAALLDDKDIKDNPEAKLQKQEAGRQLELLGATLQKSYAQEKLNPILKEYTALSDKAAKEGLTPIEEQRMLQLEHDGKPFADIIQQVNDNESTQTSRYPMSSYLDANNFAQELVGQKHTGLGWLAAETGKATENTAKGIWDIVSEPFRSDENSNLHQAEILGSSNLSQNSAYLKQENQLQKSFKPELSEELQKDIDAIKNDPSLSDSQKLSKASDLLMSRAGEWRRSPVENGETNIGLTSLMYGVGGLAANLAPFVLGDLVTGGGVNAGALKKFSSMFTSAAATSFHDAYVDALKRGEENPFAHAARVTAINSAALAGADAPAAIRKMIGGETAIGKLVSKMTDDEIAAALKESPKALTAFGKSLDAIKKTGGQIANTSLQSFKSGAKIAGITTAGQAVNDAIDKELKSPIDYAKQAAIETLKFGVGGTMAGIAGRAISKPTEMNLAAISEAGKNPEPFLMSLETMEKNGSISPEQAQQVRTNIEKANKIFKSSPILNNPDITDKVKREYLYNTWAKKDIQESMAELPPKMAEKAEMEAMVLDHKNELLLHPPTDKQLESQQSSLEKKLEPKKDAEGKSIELPEKEKASLEAELEAVKQTIEARQKEVPETKTEEVKSSTTVSSEVNKASNVGGDVGQKFDIKRGKNGFEGDFLNDYELIGEGSEHTVYRKKGSDKVIRLSEPYSDKSETTFNQRVRDAKLIDEIIGDGSLNVIGYYESENGTKNPIYEQNFQDSKPISEKEVEAHLRNIGGIEYGDKYNRGYLFNHNGKWYKINDYSDNFFKDKNGKIVAIDAAIVPISEAEINKARENDAEFNKAVEKSYNDAIKEQMIELPKEEDSVGVGGDVEATAKALEDLSKNKTERFYPDDKVILTTKDGKEVEVSFRGYNGEKKAVIFGSRGSGINQMEVDVSQLRAKNKSDKLTKDERNNLLSKIDFQDKEAPTYKDDFTDKELQDLSVRYPKRDKLSNKEKNDLNDFQIATTPLKRWQEQEYGVDDPLDPTNIRLAKEHETAINNIINNDKFSTLLAEAYHKAKVDGSNPELVKAVEQSLKETPKSENKPIQNEPAASSTTVSSGVDKASNVGGDVEATTKALDDIGRTQTEEGDIIDKILLQKSKDLREEDGTVSDKNLKEFKDVVSARASINAAIAIRPKAQGSKERYVLSNKEISEAYHKAKADGSNPELVKAVEQLLGQKDSPSVQPQAGDVGVGVVGVDIPKSQLKSIKNQLKEKYDNALVAFSKDGFIQFIEEDAQEVSKILKSILTKSNDYDVTGFSGDDAESNFKKILKNGNRIALYEVSEQSLKETTKAETTTTNTGVEEGSGGVRGDLKQQELDAQKINKEAGVDVYVARQGVKTKGEKYTLSQIKENGNTNTFVIEDANGSEIGKAQLSADGNYLENIRIDEKHRRKGLASKVYDFIELRKGIELQPSPNKQSKEAKALWDNRNLKKSVSNKANGGLLAKSLGEAMSKTFADFKNKQQVLLELENKYFEQKGISKEDFNKLSETEKAEIIKDAVKWKNNNPELVKAVEQSLKETPKSENKPIQNEPIKEGAESNEPIPTEEVKPTEGSPVEAGIPTKPPKETEGTGIVSEPKRTVFSHRGLQEVATEFGLNDIRSRDKVSDLQLFKGADETINKWAEEGSYKKNIDDLVVKAKAGEIFSPEQNVIMAQHIAQMREQAKQAREKFGINSPEYNEQLKQLQDITTIGQKVRSDIGAALRVPTFSRTYMPTLEDAMTAKMEANGTDVLTERQKAEVEKEFDKIKKSRDEAEKNWKDAEARFTEMQAQNELLKQQTASKGKSKSSSTSKTGNRDYKAERKSYKDELKSLVEEYKAAGQKMGITSDGGAESFIITTKMARAIMKIVGSHLEETGAKLADVTKKTFDDIKDLFDGITEADVHDVIAGKYTDKKTRSELSIQLNDIRTEAKLLDEYNRLLNKEPKSEKEKQAKNARLTELRKNIKELQKEQGEGQYSDKQKAERAIAANNKREQEIRDKIAKGDFEPKPKPKSFIESKEFKAQYPELYKKALDSYNAKQDAQHDFDVALLRDSQAKRYQIVPGKNKLGTILSAGRVGKNRAVDFAGAAANTTKKLVTGVDDSSLFMQTLAAMTARPVVAAKALKLHALDALSQKRFDRNLAELHNSPDWDLMQKSGLDVTEPKSLSQLNREEAFSGKTLDLSVKFKGEKHKVLETLLAPFERAFTSLGNGMRVIAFRTLAEKYMSEGKTFENDPKLYKDLALMLNTETGRGKQNEYIQKASELVTKGIWSPRLMASRLNMLGISDAASIFLHKAGTKGYYSQLHPEIRKEALKSLVAFSSTVLTLSYLAAWKFGGTVDNDPRSQTFLDIKMPNGKSYNISGGFSQYIRVVAQSVSGGISKNGVYQPFNGQKEAGSNLLHFMRGKVTPVAGVGTDLLTGKDFAGQPVTLGGEAAKLTLPLSLQGVVNDVKKDGLSALYNATLPSFVGITVKDERDYTSHKFSPEATKLLQDNQIPIKMPSKKYIKDGEEVDMTEDEYKKYLTRVDERIDYGLQELKQLVSDGRVQSGDIPESIKEIVSDANGTAKEELFGFQIKKDNPPPRRVKSLPFEKKND